MSSEKNNSTVSSVAVIGSGPAGWTASLYLARAGLEPLMFEGELDGKMIPGGQLMTTTEVENYPGFPNGGISGWDMMEKFKQQAIEFGTIVLPYKVTNVTQNPDSKLFEISASNDQIYLVKSVIISTGATAKYLGLESEQTYLNKGVSACATCDGALPRFRNKPIVVVGGGDTAMEEALFLTKFASKVYIIHRRDKFRASPIMAKRALEHEKIEVIWHTVVDQVLGDQESGVTGTTIRNINNNQVKTLECSGFFAAIGHQPNSELFLKFVQVDENGYIITHGKTTHTNSPGVFACGDVQDKIYRQAVTAAGSGCSAAIDCTRWLESIE